MQNEMTSIGNNTRKKSVETEIQLAFKKSDFGRVATVTLNHYGNEILGFLATYLRNWSYADDVYSIFLEDFWLGLPRFEWRCTMRAWAYTLARHAAVRYITNPAQHPHRILSLNDVPEVSDAARMVRETTPRWMQTDVKSRVQKLRERLLPEEQALLVLRIDRGMSWRELAMVMSDSKHFLEGQELDMEIQKFRKRFERIKAKLKRRAQQNGLLQEQN